MNGIVLHGNTRIYGGTFLVFSDHIRPAVRKPSPRAKLQAEGIPVRVVSMPCREWFAEQDQDWRDRVLPPGFRVRVSVEAGAAQDWRDYVGDAGRSVSLERFGASADHRYLYEEFGITAQAVADAAHATAR